MRRISNYRVSLIFFCTVFISSALLAQDFEMLTIAEEVPTGWGVTSGDYDGDGDIDFAATGKNPGRIVWYETRFNQEPIEHFLYSVGRGARYISSGDLDNDGDLDLVVAGYGEDRFIWFENRGTDFPDVFEIHDLLDGQSGAWQAIPVDLDRNGTNDIAMCNYNGRSVSLMLTSPSGEHGLLVTTSVPDPIGLFGSDYDRDGDMDVLIASSSTTQGGLYVMEQTAPLEFELVELFVESGLRLTSVCAADLDNDDDIDLIATQISDVDGVSWWERAGEGLIRHNLSGYMYLPRNVVTADFDGDHLIDIAATWHGSNIGMGGIYWWRNIGEGAFEYHVIHDGESPYDLHSADFDLDGDADLLVPLAARGEVVLLRNLLGITALIQGVVASDREGTPIKDILVSVIETGISAITDTAGFYRLNTSPGFYTIEIRDACWEELRVESVAAVEDSTTIQNLELRRPLIAVAQSSLNAQVYNEHESELFLAVENRGDALLVVDAIVAASASEQEWLSITPDHVELLPGQDIQFSVVVAPDTSNESAWDFFGEIELHSNACPDTVIEIPVFVRVLDIQQEIPAIPITTRLYPVYPNPFNSETRIHYDLAVSGNVKIVLYDIQGRQVQNLYSDFSEAGSHDLELSGRSLASGLYFLRMTTGSADYTQKLHLLK